MKSFILGAAGLALVATGAFAQTAHTTSSHNPAIKDNSAATVAAPAHGSNSFTEDQARGRLEKAGYTGVSKLAKDKNGVWRGSAMHDGKTVQIGLDYKGNVTTK